MFVTLHLAFAAVICFGVSEARQQEHDIGKNRDNMYIIFATYLYYLLFCIYEIVS